MIEAHIYQPEAFARTRTLAQMAGLIALTQPHQEQPVTEIIHDNPNGIPADRPCYVPGPNALRLGPMWLAHGASSGWHFKLRGADVKKNGNEAFWQGLIDGGILVDVHGHDLPAGTATLTVERTESLLDRVENAEARAATLENRNTELSNWLRGAIDREEAGGAASIGAALIAAERRHAIEECGFDAAHDAQHTPAELACAAVAYIFNNHQFWPFGDGFNPLLPHRRRLIIAGQFIAAAIDRLEADPRVPTHGDLADKGSGVHAVGWERGFQHALNLVERLGGWRECKDCPR